MPGGNEEKYKAKSHFVVQNFQKLVIGSFFRPPFINGRPQETVSVFGRSLPPVFEVISPPYFQSQYL